MLSSPERPAVCGLDQWRAARGCYRVRAHGLRQDLADLCRPNGVPPRPWAATSGVLYIDPSSRGVVPVGGQPAMQQAVRRVVREICNCESELHDDTYITSPPAALGLVSQVLGGPATRLIMTVVHRRS